jgi:cytochrome c556
MKKLLIASVAALLPLTGFTGGHGGDVLEERQAAFKEIKEAMAAVKDAMKAEDFAAAKTSAETVLTNAQAVTQLFPAGSYEGDTRAKKKIWEKEDDFTARQQQLVTDAEALVTATDSNDKKALKKAFKTTSKNCKGCHMKYRQIL